MSSTSRWRKPLMGLACAFALLDSGASVRAQIVADWEQAVSKGLTPRTILGLVNVPELVGGGCGPDVPATINLYGGSTSKRPPIGAIEFEVTGREPRGRACASARVVLRRAGRRTTEAMPMEESGYEIPAAIAFARVANWFEIAIPGGSAWIKRENEADFLQYPDLLKDRLAHMTAGWDGKLWSAPDRISPSAVSPKVARVIRKAEAAHTEVDVEVLAIRRVKAQPWIQVRVTDGHCGDGNPVTLETGWVLPYRQTRHLLHQPWDEPTSKPSVWFYSRGC